MLIWPEPRQLLQDARDNHRRLNAADAVRLQGIPLPELRRRQRQWIGHADDDQLLIATGHQTELHHPGVWVKNALIHAAASAVGGQAYHFAVDSDEPKHLSVQWPDYDEPITDDPHLRQAAWSGLLAAPSPAHIQQIHQNLDAAQAHWFFTPMLGTYLDMLRRLALEADRLPPALVNAAHALDWDLGLRHHALLTSPLWHSEPYLLFVHHLLARARQFGTQYNAALHDYRQEHGLKSTMRPMPDLHLDAHGLEVPFWLDDLATGARTRALLLGPERPWRLVLANGDSFAFESDADGWEAAERLKRFLARHQLRLAPRALTLTLFFRLLLVDQFVHGIGGGRYDQVLDRLIAAHFNLPAPRFSVTTATLIFPQALGQTRACVPCVLQEGHQLKHRLLGDRKRQWLDRINALPPRSLQRRMAFYALHDQLDTALATDPRIPRWQQRLADTQRQAREDQVLFNRELFYAIQPRARLEAMIARYAQAFDKSV
jgi:hypothetical protein